ncbi:MAG: winged helix-turn-helix transcriptional regulator [Erysipelothrix sp.]|nr:winged helix-turn-helix transcriptional regulator [Erysipelothrix sp.]
MEKEVSNTLRKTNKLLVDIFRAQIGQYDLTYRLFHILIMIKDNPDITQKQLAERLKLTQGAISGSIKALLSKDYLKQVPLAEDNRYNRLVLTPKIKVIINENKNLLDYRYNQMFEGFTLEELEVFDSYLQRLNKNLEKVDFNFVGGENS